MSIFSHIQRGPAGRQYRRLRRECEARVASLDIPEWRDMAELCALLGRERGRRIRLFPMRLGASHPCGLWVASSTEEIVVYETDTTRLHQEHIIAHEIAHMICCHRGSGALNDASARLLFPDVDPQLVRDMLRRGGYSDPEEQEAELVASLLLGRSLQRPVRTEPGLAPAAAAVIARIERTVGRRTAAGTSRHRWCS